MRKKHSVFIVLVFEKSETGKKGFFSTISIDFYYRLSLDLINHANKGLKK
jgi:hypothetical protein